MKTSTSSCRLRAVFLVWAIGVISLTPAAAQDITVTAADPAVAEQGVTLDVEISGSGFKKGARASFLITGTANPGGVTVNSTAFVNPNKLVANITVALDAQNELKYDVAVTSAGRTGKGIELFGVLKTTGSGVDVQARADFDPYGLGLDRVRSDGKTVCDSQVDFADKDDALCAVAAGAELDKMTISQNLTGGLYFLRNLPACCSDNEQWGAYTLAPQRWLVLDFTVGPGACRDIDAQVQARAAATDWGALNVVPPAVDPDPCVDNVSVRFRASSALNGSSTTSTVEIIIDEPQLVISGKGKKQVQRLVWNELYRLIYRDPLVVTGSGPVVLQTMTSDLADLFDVNGTFVGTYHMPLTLRLERTQ